MKTKEELNKLKEEVEAVNEKCRELTPEELKDVTGGATGHIRNFCDRYNASSGKEYNVGVSLGFYCAVPEENDTIDSFYNLADEKMYEDKFRRKKNRR